MAKNYERLRPPTPDNSFKALIDDKFINSEPIRGSYVRDYEEEIVIVPKKRLSLCPWAKEATLKRPLKEQEQLANNRWKTFGGHRLTVKEAADTMQTDFYIKDNNIWYRQIILNPVEYSLIKQDKRYQNLGSKGLENNVIKNIYFKDDLSISLNFKDKNNSFGEQLTKKQTQELFKWIEDAEIKN